MIVGMALMAELLGVHVPKGYIYAAMPTHSGEGRNIRVRSQRQKQMAGGHEA
ncbi:hypothetical protein [Aquabacterium sp. NJ1]|uniref:hypothetical protein n=1 Tax=Aquabacterium sp. NJ1 TaxID=1538295 RepID=UPI0013772D83|nr:hypothetical protein [Aquabacterium sp. NJ1]